MIIEPELDAIVLKYFGEFYKKNQLYFGGLQIRYISLTSLEAVIININNISIWHPKANKYFNSIRDLERYLILLPFE